MAESIIAYDRDLPEIPDRRPWEKPTSFLLKGDTPGNWLIDDSGRRPSNLLLVNKLRVAVDTWREQGYPGASDVTQRLFEYWFESKSKHTTLAHSHPELKLRAEQTKGTEVPCEPGLPGFAG